MVHNREAKPEQMRHRIDCAKSECKFGAQRAFTLAIQPPNPEFLRERYDPYEFVAPRSQQDLVLRLIRDTIFALNETPGRGLIMWNHNIRVVPSTTAPPIWPPNASDTNDVKFYTFSQDKKEFPATLPVSVIPRTGELTADKVHVRKAGAWVSISEFLLNLADDSILYKRSVESSLYIWYKRTRKTFRLMDLPTKLRLQILEHAIAPMGKIHPLNKACRVDTWDQDFADHHITLGIGYYQRGHDHISQSCVTRGPGSAYAVPKTYEAHPNVPAPNMSLLYVSKQISQEALKVAWEGPTKCFLDHWLFIPVLESRIGAAAQFNHLNRIELAFTPRSWFKFFGVEVKPTVRITESDNLGYYLGRLAKNTHVQIRFRDPSDGYAGDPWGCTLHENSDEWEEGTYKSTTCQSIIVNWILTFAYQHIKHTKVTVTGCVRKPQKNFWDAIFHKARRGEVHEHDNQAELKAIFDLNSSELPPTCICRMSCTSPYRNRYRDKWNIRSGSYARFSPYSCFDYEDGPLPEQPLHEWAW